VNTPADSWNCILTVPEPEPPAPPATFTLPEAKEAEPSPPSRFKTPASAVPSESPPIADRAKLSSAWMIPCPVSPINT